MISPMITCEHGGNDIPPEYIPLFRGKEGLLKTHRGYDRGALDIARAFAASCGVPLFSWNYTRLLIDMNRMCCSETLFTLLKDKLTDDEKETIISIYHNPYWDKVASHVSEGIVRCGMVAHIAVHSFTPVLKGVVRETDIGLLYDPKRSSETLFCRMWKKELRKIDQHLVVRMNYPYTGYNDGLTTGMRKWFTEVEYMGIELEINQKFLHTETPRKHSLVHAVIESYKKICEKF
jgi:predicted N-formylglutamate amidohydrolase